MLDVYTVSFFGHREVEGFSEIEERLEGLIQELLCTKEYVEFLVGRNGEFDQMVSSEIKKLKKRLRDDNCCHILVLPYITAEYRENENAFHEYYDEVEICREAVGAHFKAAFQKRNREMVDRSDLIVFYIEREHGGAYQTYQYAVNRGKRVVNLTCTEQGRK